MSYADKALPATAASPPSSFFSAAEFGSEAAAIDAGEAATATGNLFWVVDDAGSLIERQRTLAGSREMARSGAQAHLLRSDALDRVGFAQGDQGPFIQTRTALDKLRERGASLMDTGAKGDFQTDDSDALQEISDHFGKRGGKWSLPAGVYRVTKPIILRCDKAQIISGQGKRSVYPGKFDPDSPTALAVIVPVHEGRQAFKFLGTTNGDGSLSIRDLAIAALPEGPRPEACFGWDTSDGIFLRDFSFLHVSINGFRSAFDVHASTGSMRQVGMFRAMFCTIHHNEWIARTLDGNQWNGFEFASNEAGQNGYLPGQGGIDISGHSVNIIGNSLEGMRDPIRIRGIYRGIDIRGNYFEGNVGKALVQLAGVRGPFDIGPQAHTVIDYHKLEHPVLLSQCGLGRCAIPYRGDVIHKMEPAVIGADELTGDLVNNRNIGTTSDGWLRCDTVFAGASVAPAPSRTAASNTPLQIAERESNPLDGAPLPVAKYMTSANTALESVHDIDGKVGEWAAFCILIKREDRTSSPADPELVLSAAAQGAAVDHTYRVQGFDSWWRAGEWCLLTAAIRLERAMPRLAVRVFPYGISPPSGRRVRYLRPLAYTTDHPDKIRPVIDWHAARSLRAPPAAGRWLRGDVLTNSAPTGAGGTQFVCIESGTPGTWVDA